MTTKSIYYERGRPCKEVWKFRIHLFALGKLWSEVTINNVFNRYIIGNVYSLQNNINCRILHKRIPMFFPAKTRFCSHFITRLRRVKIYEASGIVKILIMDAEFKKSITLNCLIVPISAVQRITISRSQAVNVLEIKIQNNLGPPFNKVPLDIQQVCLGNIICFDFRLFKWR